FFFQAEDGIREFHVTGVQTCALPISERGLPWRRCSARRASRVASKYGSCAVTPIGRGRTRLRPSVRTRTVRRTSWVRGVLAYLRGTRRSARSAHGPPRQRTGLPAGS